MYFEQELIRAETAVRRACDGRNASVFVRGARPLTLLHRLSMRVHQKSVLDWALVNLDAWGVEQVLAGGHYLAGANVLAFFSAVTAMNSADPGTGDRLLKQQWPVMWPAADRNAAARASVLEALFTKHDVDPALLDLPQGPFSQKHHHRLINAWEITGLGFGNVGLRLSPVQLAWQRHDVELCRLLVANGVGLDDCYEDSSWPAWSLSKVLGGVNRVLQWGEKLGRQERLALDQVLKRYQDDSALQSAWSNQVRQAVMTRDLPAASVASKHHRF